MSVDWEPEDLSREQRLEMAEAYKRHMLYGALWFFGGLIVTVATMSGGGRFILAWGAIIFGAIDFLRGLSGWMKFK
ncbi:MAG TPA: hypothetical protein VGP72_13275 [Planctomycetota bacterium]|jgi:hypothetical protein